MATITSAQTGNFSSTSTWVGGVVPTSADDAVAATGHVVTIDTDVTVISFQQAGTGKFMLGGGRTVTGNVIANAGTFTSGGTIEVIAGAGTTATINGNLTGASTTGINIAAVVVSGLGTLVLNGNITPQQGSSSTFANAAAMLYTNVASNIQMTGSILTPSASSSFKHGVQLGALSTTATFSMSGNVFGTGVAGSDCNGIVLRGTSNTCVVTGQVTGTNTGGHGVYVPGTASVTITGNVVGAGNNGVRLEGNNSNLTVIGNITCGAANQEGIRSTAAICTVSITGNVTGSTNTVGVNLAGGSDIINMIGTATGVGTTGHAIICPSVGVNTGVIFQGNMIDGSGGAVAIYTRLFRITGTQTGYNQHQNTVGFPNGTPVFRVSPDQVTGMPAISNVRSGTVFGYSNQLTGTMAVPAPQSVSYGVPVDNTTGTASLRPEDIAALVGAQVAAGAKGVN